MQTEGGIRKWPTRQQDGHFLKANWWLKKKQQLGHGSRNCRKMLKSLSAVAGWGYFKHIFSKPHRRIFRLQKYMNFNLIGRTRVGIWRVQLGPIGSRTADY